MKLFHMQEEVKWSNEGQYIKAREGLYYWAGVAVLNQFARLRLTLDVQMGGPMPSGPKIFAGNHPTTTDPFYLLTVLPEKTRMMVNADIFKKPFLGGLFRRSGHIAVDKKDGIQALNAGISALERGENLGIFPEGGLSDIQEGIKVNRLKTGVVRMALQAGAPIIPVGFHMPIEGMKFKSLKVGGEKVISRFFLRGRYAITLGQPFWVTGDVEDRKLVRALSEELRDRIYDLSQLSALRLKNNLPLAKESRKKKKSLPVESGM
ncbi:MAG: 1-acyl-sn-glycerol-3-phosphate acyltransferase [Anaerolineales bacterium]|nr:1-acyl-sn-glycerol-3-phosphate acyltransferase [Anaerolineales bacterium]